MAVAVVPCLTDSGFKYALKVLQFLCVASNGKLLLEKIIG